MGSNLKMFKITIETFEWGKGQRSFQESFIVYLFQYQLDRGRFRATIFKSANTSYIAVLFR